MDRALKRYADEHRPRGTLPEELDGKIRGALVEDQALIDRWRNWRSGLRWVDPETGIELSGALDDCLCERRGERTVYTPLDFKTRGAAPGAEMPGYYRTPMEAYALLLDANGFDSSGYGYLIYYWPSCVDGPASDDEVGFRFEVDVQEHHLDLERVKALLGKVRKVLGTAEPKANDACPYCKWASQTAA